VHWLRVVTTEDNVLAMIEDTCRGRAPLFTQQHEVLELTGEVDVEKMDFRVRTSVAVHRRSLDQASCLPVRTTVSPSIIMYAVSRGA
jgi:hypothetical protein